VGHTKSPLIHAYWLEKYQIDAAYNALDIASEQLKDFCYELRKSEWRGCNVTVPHKETIMPLLDDLDPDAEMIGAVNTVVNRDGRLFGANTDGFGFVAHLKETIPDYDFTKPVMILGAGGAARGIIAALKKEGVQKIYIVNRDQERARNLQKDFLNVRRVFDWDN